MKKLLVIILLLTMLVGCKTRKAVVKSDVEVKTEQTYVAKVDEQKNVQTSTDARQSVRFDITDNDSSEMTEISRSFSPQGTITSETIKTIRTGKSVQNRSKTSDMTSSEVKDESTTTTEVRVVRDSTATDRSKTKELTDTQKTGTNLKWIALSTLGLAVVILILRIWKK